MNVVIVMRDVLEAFLSCHNGMVRLIDYPEVRRLMDDDPVVGSQVTMDIPVLRHKALRDLGTTMATTVGISHYRDGNGGVQIIVMEN